MRRSNEPLFWSLFSAGGVVLALLAPALILVTGFLAPAERVEFERLETLLAHALGRVVLLGLAVLGFFHAAHRLRHTLVDVGLRAFARPITVIAYAVAAAGTVWAATVVFA